MRKRATLAAVLAAVMALPALTVAPDADAAKTRKRAAKLRLKAFGSCAGLVRYGQRYVSRGPGAGFQRPAPPGPAPVPGPPSEGGAPGAPTPAPAPTDDTSPTNVQEPGVDEPDIVKARGSRIFAVAAGRLHAIDGGAGGPRLLGSLPLEGYAHDLLLFRNRLLVFTQSYAGGPEPVPPPGPGPAPDGVVAPGRVVTVLTEVDVSDPAAMRVVRTEKVDGAYLSARLTGATARVVVSSTPLALYETGLRSELRGWMPTYELENRSTGRRTTRRLVACRNVRRPRAFSGVDMLTVLTIDMSRGLPAVDSDGLMTSGQIAYASTRSLYVATPKWTPEPDAPSDQPPRSFTAIHKFDISDPAETVYRGSGEVFGYLLNQFALSEYRGVLRVASTETPTWWGGAPRRESESFVTTLEGRSGALVQLGRVDGLGRGERIYAVRFIDEAGFVVTFRQVDPLYTIDLARPSQPRVLGELKIQGYSAYLHPLRNDLLLGVGQDATEEGRLLGTQLSLFDVSNLRNPVRLHSARIGSGSSSEVEYDHHAFLWWPPAKLAVIPVQLHPVGPVEPGGTGEAFTGAVGFRVGRTDGINEAGRASHDAGTYAAPVRRAFVVGGRLFTLSEAGIEANSLTTLAEEAWLPFPPPPPPPPSGP
jgi:hypothetical protein